MVALRRLRAPTALRLFACAGLLMLAGCGTTPGLTCSSSAPASCVRVLFLGNSYTFVNGLPGTFAQLAHSGGHPVQAAMVANGGETLPPPRDYLGATVDASVLWPNRDGH